MQLCFTAIDGEDKTHIHYLFIHGQFGFGVDFSVGQEKKV